MIQVQKQWLADRHIIVPEDWLQACVDWLHEENQGQQLAQNAVNGQVYEQWLLSDLHELETQCLPAEVGSAEKFQLNGAYALQIDSILDVGKSFYSQQQKYKGTENANTKVSADEPEVKPWEMKPTRMLMMTLTDGKQTVKGMEYKPISSLNPQTHPGAKILVHGSVLCRHGILMLSEGTIKCLGGEVDTLMEENTILNSLQTAMDASVEHAEKHYRQVFRGTDITHSQKPRPSQLQQQQQRPIQAGRQGSSTSFKQELPSQKYQPMKTEIQSQRSNVAPKVNLSRNNNVEDAWDDDDADLMDAFMDDMDEDLDPPTSQRPGTSANNNNSGAFNNTGTTHRVIGSRNFSNTSELTGLGANQTNNASRTLNSCNGRQNQTVNRKTNNTSKNKSSITSFTTASNVISSNNDNNHGIDKNDDTLSSSKKQNVSTDAGEFDDDEFEDEMYLPPMEDEDFEIPHSKPKQKRGSTLGSESINTSVRSGTQNEFQKASHVLSTERQVETNLRTEQNKSSFGASGEMARKQQSASDTDSKLNIIQHSVQSKTAAAAATATVVIKQEVKSEAKPDVNSYVTTEYPFTYLFKVMSLPKHEEARIHTVKAYISTLTSRLATDTGQWSLACKVNDGTMAIEVDISDKVLTDMIGFSYEQSKVMRVEAARNPKIKEKLKKGIQEFQQKLVNLMCLLEIEVCSRYKRPVVVATQPITTNHVNMLYNRVLSNMGK